MIVRVSHTNSIAVTANNAKFVAFKFNATTVNYLAHHTRKMVVIANATKP